MKPGPRVLDLSVILLPLLPTAKLLSGSCCIMAAVGSCIDWLLSDCWSEKAFLGRVLLLLLFGCDVTSLALERYFNAFPCREST